ncbi:MAG: hypothetical protein EOP85_15930 [Verrucomicrobiaceae bacterium]|nr:MAG: hypothetical protein EOP85_15930 [Verrucomicrobiaceae bacterium]
MKDHSTAHPSAVLNGRGRPFPIGAATRFIPGVLDALLQPGGWKLCSMWRGARAAMTAGKSSRGGEHVRRADVMGNGFGNE